MCRSSSAAPSWPVAQFPAPLQGAAEPQSTSPDLLSALPDRRPHPVPVPPAPRTTRSTTTHGIPYPPFRAPVPSP
ncbi:stress protein, partial [Streptomyces violarus]|nr:stress protein [Streptomyces violarus]